MNPCTARHIILSCVLLVLGTATLFGQRHITDTFYVTVVPKTSAHPYFGMGSDFGYALNGVESPVVRLVRDSTYIFNVTALADSFSFGFYSIPIGGTSGRYQDHVVTIDFANDNWIVRASEDTRDTLYYASSAEPWVGGTILVVDSITTSVQDDSRSQSRVHAGTVHASPNPFSQTTTLRFTLEEPAAVRVGVFNMLGQEVYAHDYGSLSLGMKELNLSAPDLLPGMYVVQVTAHASRKTSVLQGKIHVVE